MHSGVKPLTGYLGNQFRYLIYFFKNYFCKMFIFGKWISDDPPYYKNILVAWENVHR